MITDSDSIDWIYVIKLNCALPYAWAVNPPQIPRLVESPWLSSVNYGKCFTCAASSAMQWDKLEKAINYLNEHQHIKEFTGATIWRRYRYSNQAKWSKCVIAQKHTH